jgi:hypothetical protein
MLSTEQHGRASLDGSGAHPHLQLKLALSQLLHLLRELLLHLLRVLRELLLELLRELPVLLLHLLRVLRELLLELLRELLLEQLRELPVLLLRELPMLRRDLLLELLLQLLQLLRQLQAGVHQLLRLLHLRQLNPRRRVNSSVHRRIRRNRHVVRGGHRPQPRLRNLGGRRAVEDVGRGVRQAPQAICACTHHHLQAHIICILHGGADRRQPRLRSRALHWWQRWKRRLACQCLHDVTDDRE